MSDLLIMDKEVFEVVLKRCFNDSKIKRIIDLKWEPVLPKGENYTSTILKATLKVVLGNGRIAKKTFIAKKENSGEAAEQLNNDYNMFKLESNHYTKILREMDYLMEEFEDTEGPLWCKFIYSSEGIIVLEDLTAAGFVTVKRTDAQDLEHAKLVMRSQGRYHAMAKVLEERGLVSKDEYKKYAFLSEDSYIRNFMYGGRKALIKGMKKAWGQEWSHAADVLSQVSFEEFSKLVKDCAKLDGDTFYCLNHGDCWSNNMLFKYSWDGRPIAVRFVDYQGPHYNISCVDVIYYLYTSLRPQVRRDNYESLVELYHRSLVSSLDKFGYKGSKPSLEEIRNAMERLSFFAMNFFVVFFPLFQTKGTDGMDIDKVFKTNGEEGFNVGMYHEDDIKEKICEEVLEIVKYHEAQ